MLIQADARHLPLRDECVQCAVTSPPYFGLRDYETDRQIGLESTPDDYVRSMVAVFREVRRVLKSDGVCWLNLGDSFGKPKNLLGIPWRVALALQADGWYLRSDIIWSKPNPMPEPVTDRPTKSHEYLFLLSKSQRYYYDAAAIAERYETLEHHQRYHAKGDTTVEANKNHGNLAGSNAGLRGGRLRFGEAGQGRNKRSVWTIPLMPYAGAHFATFPEALVQPCILAGSRLGDLIFDPFVGSGTVGTVAERFGRRWTGTDLNTSYHQLAKRRTAQRGIRFEQVNAE